MNTDSRFEFKYILDPHTALDIEMFIKRIGLVLDPKARHRADSRYTVTSLYFDSPYFSDYHKKVDGISERKKVRARTYPNAPEFSNHVWFEIKYKHDMYVAKHRLRLSADAWRSFRNTLLEKGTFEMPTGEDNSPENHEFLKELKQYVIFGAMRPHVVVRYERRPYVGSFQSPLRITFDSQIQACRSSSLHTHPSTVLFEKERVIMEVKFNGSLPQWFGELVRQFGLKREKYSKYEQSVNAVYGELYLPAPHVS